MDGDAHLRFAASRVYCNDKLLRTFQLASWNTDPDSKTFVDRPLRVDPDKVLKRFKKLDKNISEATAKKFLVDNFYPSPNDDDQIAPYIPPDFTDEPPSFAAIFPTEHPIRDFSTFIKNRWKMLCRKFKTADAEHVFAHNPRSSLIPLPYPFIIPGGRFREVYYWDSLWIVHGLLASDMKSSAISVVRNLLYMVKELGFVPNGNRVYYLNRSQPPVLAECVHAIFEHITDSSERLLWVLEALPLIEREYKGFLDCRSVRSRTKSDALGPLAAYRVRTERPRPESYREDTETASRAKQRDPRVRRAQVYQDLASAAESGWDFSSRWFRDPKKGIATIRTSQVVPVCLNAILLRAERVIAELFAYLALHLPSVDDGHYKSSYRDKSTRYANTAERRARAMMTHFWSDLHEIWVDYDLSLGTHTGTVSSAGCFALWAGAWQGYWDESDAANFVDAFMTRSNLVHTGGVAATTTSSSEQWDHPNMWPPVAHIVVDGLRKLHREYPACGAGAAAEEIAMRTVRTIYRGWSSSGEMHEKYDATDECGERGVGGEYKPQLGFGWTNGVALKLMQMYSREILHAEPGRWLSEV